MKSEFVIGGYVTGSNTVEKFLETWSPMFEDYLNEEVGKQQFPEIRFRFIAVDFSVETSLKDMIDAGLIDLVCEHISDL
jgi:hypothetical protein